MKKFLSILSALAVITTVSCSSTGSSSQEQSAGENSSASTAEALTETTLQTLYKETVISLDNVPDITLSVQKSADKVHYFFVSVDNDLCHAVVNSNYEVEKEEIMEKNFYSNYSFLVNEDNSFYMMHMQTDYEFEYDDTGMIQNYSDFQNDGKASFILRLYDADGKIASENEIIGLDREYQLNRSVMIQLCHYGENRLIFSFGNGLAVMEADGTLLETEHYENSIINLGTDSSGNIIASTGINYGIMDSKTPVLPESMNEEDDFDPDLQFFGSAEAGAGEYTMFVRRTDGIYGIKSDGSEELVFNFADSLVDENIVSEFISMGDGKFITAGYGTDSFCLYERRPDDYTEDRTVIDLWQIGFGANSPAITRFNKSQDKYLVKLHSSKKETELRNAILTDDSPDVIEYGGYDNMMNFINLGALADMNELMDKYGGISREQIMPNVLSAYDVDGHLYTLPEWFLVDMTIANSEYIGKEYQSCKFDDLYRFYDEGGEDMHLYADMWGSSMWNFIIENLNPWIDLEKNTCNFDSPEFIKLLEFCKKTDNSHFEFDTTGALQSEIATSLRDHKALLLNEQCSGLDSLIGKIGTKMLKFDDVTIMYPPETNGKGYIITQQTMSVLSGSDCIEGAWAYVAFMLDEERQCEEAKHWGGTNMTNKKAFDIAIENCITKGDKPEIGHSTFYGDNGNYTIDLERTITREQAEKYREFVMNCDTLQYGNSGVSEIIQEEFGKFLNDEITAEECAEYIQNRSEIMLSEKS